MKNKLLRLLAVACIFMATSANAAITLSELNASASSYVAANPSVSPAWSSLSSCCQNTIQVALNEYNSKLSTTPACSSVGASGSTNWNACYNAFASLPVVASGGTTIPVARMVLDALAKQQTPPTTTPSTPSTPCCTSGATAITEVIVPQIQRATSIQQATIISNVVSNIFSTRASVRPGAQIRMSLGGEKGMAAGDSPAKLNAWLNASDTQIGATNLFGGNVTNALGGVDYMVSPQFVGGVGLGYDRVSLGYSVPLAASTGVSGLTSTGWMAAPYASYQINDIVSVDGIYGYASGDSKSGVVTTGYTRNFFALNLNGNYWMGDWQLTGKANYINAEEKMNATTNKMEQLRLGGQIGYWANGVMPYASLTYVNDLKVSSSFIAAAAAAADKEAWAAGIGVNLFSKGALYGGVSYTTEFSRKDSKNDTLMANIGYRF